MFYMLLLEKEITRRKAVDQKKANQLKLEKREQPKLEVGSIMDDMVFVKKAIDSRPPGSYYLIHWKEKTHIKDTWESVEKISHLQLQLKRYYGKNPDKLTATSLPLDKKAPLFLMAARLEIKITLFILAQSKQSPQ